MIPDNIRPVPGQTLTQIQQEPSNFTEGSRYSMAALISSILLLIMGLSVATFFVTKPLISKAESYGNPALFARWMMKVNIVALALEVLIVLRFLAAL